MPSSFPPTWTTILRKKPRQPHNKPPHETTARPLPPPAPTDPELPPLPPHESPTVTATNLSTITRSYTRLQSDPSLTRSISRLTALLPPILHREALQIQRIIVLGLGRLTNSFDGSALRRSILQLLVAEALVGVCGAAQRDSLPESEVQRRRRGSDAEEQRREEGGVVEVLFQDPSFAPSDTAFLAQQIPHSQVLASPAAFALVDTHTLVFAPHLSTKPLLLGLLGLTGACQSQPRHSGGTSEGSSGGRLGGSSEGSSEEHIGRGTGRGKGPGVLICNDLAHAFEQEPSGGYEWGEQWRGRVVVLRSWMGSPESVPFVDGEEEEEGGLGREVLFDQSLYWQLRQDEGPEQATEDGEASTAPGVDNHNTELLSGINWRNWERFRRYHQSPGIQQRVGSAQDGRRDWGRRGAAHERDADAEAFWAMDGMVRAARAARGQVGVVREAWREGGR